MSNWMPGTRAGILEMCRSWLAFLADHASDIGVPAAEVTALGNAETAATEALDKASGEERGPVNTAACNTAFGVLKAKMRFIKDRFLKAPPLSDAQLIALGLKPKDGVRTEKPKPGGQFIMVVSSSLNGVIRYRISQVDAVPPDARGVIEGYRMYYGILPPGGATPEQAAGPKHYLTKPPTAGEELPLSYSTSRIKGDVQECDAVDRGSTFYFSIRAENNKGPGPWGPIISVILA
ncbi:hypothetical protein FACS189468_0650 [Spirochaetia bacterium]|nr:hypothetical protein FACS189468_0650 [Spirochaetia bacterium]